MIRLGMAFPGERLVIRLWETVFEKGIGALLSPWQTRREGRARIDVRREELLMIAQTERDARDIQAGRKDLDIDYKLIEHSEHNEKSDIQSDTIFRDVVASVHRTRLAQDIRGEVNVSKAVLEAEAQLENDPQPPPDRKVDEDWLLRWRDAASAVSSEELHALWGRVLAGEVKSPGSCSLRTLEFLKNLSQAEALQIAKVARFVVDGEFIVRTDKKVLESEGVTFDVLLYLHELGMVAGVEGLGLSYTGESSCLDKFQRQLISHDRILLITHEDSKKKLTWRGYHLTELGKQIFKLGSFESHEAYLLSIAKQIRSQGFEVQIARWRQLSETSGRYYDVQEIDD